jgi:hypothetical protein
VNSMELYGPGRTVLRQTERAAARINGLANLDVTRVEARQAIQEAQVDAVATVAQRAMQGLAFISQIEQQLGQAVPLAVTRLQAIGDLAALSMGQVVTDTVTKLRRL